MTSRRSFCGLVAAVVSLALFGACADDEPRAVDDIVPAPADAPLHVVAGGDAALLQFPEGQRGEVSIVAHSGTLDQTLSAHVVVRNMTTKDVTSVRVDGVLVDDAGNELARGVLLSLQPPVLEPGQVGFGYIFFSQADADDAARGTVSVSVTEVGSGDAEPLPLEPVTLTVVGDELSGRVINHGDGDIAGADIIGLCFDASGAPSNRIIDYLNTTIPAGGEASFTTELIDGNTCKAFLLTVQ